MNGLHDLGGMHGFGPAWTSPEGVIFHSDVERRVFRLMMAVMAAGWGDADGFRAAVEGLATRTYAQECFPVNYFLGLEKQLLERGLVRPGDLDAWMTSGTKPSGRPRRPPALIPDGDEPALRPLFGPGDRVRVKNVNPDGHTRMPRYLRGHTGRIIAVRGVFDFPDALAARTGRRPQPVYTVEMTAGELWGTRVSPDDRVHAELYQDYLEPEEKG